MALLDGDAPDSRPVRGSADLPRQPRDLHPADRGDVRARGVAAGRRLDHERLLHDGTHLNDMTAFGPIFVEGELVGVRRVPRALAGRRREGRRAARWTRPRSTRRASGSGRSRSWRGAGSGATSSTCSARNCRFWYPAIGDLNAQIACVRTGQRRLAAIIDRFGTEDARRRTRRDLRPDRAARARCDRRDPRGGLRGRGSARQRRDLLRAGGRTCEDRNLWRGHDD